MSDQTYYPVLNSCIQIFEIFQLIIFLSHLHFKKADRLKKVQKQSSPNVPCRKDRPFCTENPPFPCFTDSHLQLQSWIVHSIVFIMSFQSSGLVFRGIDMKIRGGKGQQKFKFKLHVTQNLLFSF